MLQIQQPLGTISIPGQERQAEADAQRAQRAGHRISSSWKDAGKHPGQGGSLGLQPGDTHSMARRGGSRAGGCQHEGHVPAGWGGPAGEGKGHTAYVEPPALARRFKQLGISFPTVTASFQALPGLASSLASPRGSPAVCQGLTWTPVLSTLRTSPCRSLALSWRA